MRYGFASLLLVALLLLSAGCGSSPPPSFALVVSPSAVTLQNGGAAQPLTVGVNGTNGFAGTVTVSLSGLPAGVTATPTNLTITPGALGRFLLTANSAPVGQSMPISVSGNAAGGGSPAATAAAGQATLQITQALSNASLSANSFSFGNSLVGSSVTQQVVTITNTGTAPITLQPALTGDASFALASATTCQAQLAAGAACTEAATYAPGAVSGTTPQTATLTLGLGNVPPDTAQTVTLTGSSAMLPAPVLTSTSNPLVAQYSVKMPFPGTVTVNFGADTTYGRQTAPVTTTTAGQTATVLVAGMPQNTTYHLQGSVQVANGAALKDNDRTFSNGASEVNPPLAATTLPGQTPQPGVEQVTMVGSNLGLLVTDLQGRPLWSYAPPEQANGYEIEGARLLPNGHYLIDLGEGSFFPLGSVPSPPNVVTAIREIDLIGNIVREISIVDLNNELAAAGYSINLQQFHHDVLPLANGHWLVLANTLKAFNNLPGYPGTTNVLGDVVIDLDKHLQPAWVWNSFDHLDVNRHPLQFPDWTHANALVYSPTDHQLLLSMRHQNWILKLDFQDGQGTGNVLWRLGQGGDFTLQGGTDPTDWFYAQHLPSFWTPTTAGVFSIGVLDNGDDRAFPPTVNCGTSGAPPCLYTTVPVYQVDETQKTATLVSHEVLPPNQYSYFGGNAELLANGDFEFDLCGLAGSSLVVEARQGSAGAQAVWTLGIQGGYAYRGYRIPSLYPGVQW